MWVIILLKRFALVFAVLFLIPFNCFGADISASSAIVMDAESKTVLYEKNANENRSMASTTKVMTALLALESNMLDTTVKINSEALATEGSSLGLKEGDKITLYDLVVGMMLTSGNDSANAVAYALAGSIEAFAEMMNIRADEIGMKNTVFVTPSGLDSKNHHSTAYDMALLTCEAVMNRSFCAVVSMKSAQITVSGKKVTVYNHNKLLSMDSDIFGVKTGFTEKAGRCLISAKNYNGRKIVCVTLNAPDDWNDHLNLYSQCEKKYVNKEIKGNIQVSVVGSDRDRLNCSYSGKACILGDCEIKIYRRPFVYAPVNKGEKIGTVCVVWNNKIIERLPITADEDLNYYVREE